MKTNVLTLVITLVLGVIMIGAVLAPVISDAEKSMSIVTYSNNNNAVELLDLVDEDDSYTITFDGSKYTLNGEEFYSCHIYTDHGWFFLNSAGITAEYARGPVTTTTITHISLIADARTIELTPGQIVVTDNTSTSYTTELGWAYITDSSGEWAVIQGDRVYTEDLNSLRYIRSFGAYIAVMEGNTALYQSKTFTDYLVSSELPNGGYEVTMPIRISNEWTTTQVIAPLSFEVEVENGYSGLFTAILVLAIVSLVMVAVGAITIKRD